MPEKIKSEPFLLKTAAFQLRNEEFSRFGFHLSLFSNILPTYFRKNKI